MDAPVFRFHGERSWRKTTAAAPASCGSGGAAGKPSQSKPAALTAPPKGGALFVLTGRWQKAPPSGELDATGGSGLRGFSCALPPSGATRRLPPAEEGFSTPANFAFDPETFPLCQGLSLWESCQSRQALTERTRTVVLRPCFLLYMYKSDRTVHTKHCTAGAAEFSTGRKACGLCILHRKCAL